MIPACFVMAIQRLEILVWEKTLKLMKKRALYIKLLFPKKDGHKNNHKGLKLSPFRCEMGCQDKTFASKRNLESHVRSIHQGLKRPSSKNFVPKLLSCSECGKKFRFALHLEAHKRTHEGVEKPYSCPQCDKKFAQGWQLKIHEERVHTSERPHSCSQCGQLFKTKNGLDKHETIHTGIKPFCCSYCGKTFREKQLLKSHEIVHTGGDKTYICSHCDYRCLRPSDLKAHERIHASVKAFGCPYCEFRCNNKRNLQSHINIHKGIKPYKCELGCTDVAFANKANLSAHIKGVHKGIKRSHLKKEGAVQASESSGVSNAQEEVVP